MSTVDVDPVDLGQTKWWVIIGAHGFPCFRDPMPPHERRCAAAYTTEELCKAALASGIFGKIPSARVDWVNASRFNAACAHRGTTVCVDLDLSTGVYHTFEPVLSAWETN